MVRTRSGDQNCNGRLVAGELQTRTESEANSSCDIEVVISADDGNESEDGVSEFQQESASAPPSWGDAGDWKDDKGLMLNGPDSAICYLRRRLLDHHSIGSHVMDIRPSLAKLQSQLIDLLSEPISKEQNASVVLLGERGVGKTLVVERALSCIEAEYNSPGASAVVGAVRLNGLVQSDDRTAFQEIASQLCRLFSLDFVRSVSVDENISFMRKVLKKLQKLERSVIFILDEFDQFAKAPKQCVLYTLLDALQTTNVRAAVVGISVRQDVLELLEKRVISRFSHRTWLVTKPTVTEEGESPVEMLKDMMHLPVQQCTNGYAQKFNRSVESAIKAPSLQGRWGLMGCIGYTPRLLVDLAITALTIMKLNNEEFLLDADVGVGIDHVLDCRDDAQVGFISDLTMPELYILIACYRLTQQKKDNFNFEMALEMYKQHVSGQNTSDNYSRGLLNHAFQSLKTMAIILPENRSGQMQHSVNHQSMYLNVAEDEIKRGLARQAKAPTSLKLWFSQHAVSKVSSF